MASEKKLTEVIDYILKMKFNNQDKDLTSLPQKIERSFKETKNNENKAKSFKHSQENYTTNLKPSEHIQPDIPDTVQLPPGKVWVKDNQVYVEGLPGHNILARIMPSKDIDLSINGQVVKNKTSVSAQDYIHVNFHTTEKPFVQTIHTSTNGLTAYMSVQLQTKLNYALVDQSPKQYMVLKTTTNIKEYCPIGMDEILVKIENEGIKYGVDYPAIQQFLANPKNGKYIIARGVPPTDSNDDVVEVLFPQKVIKHQYSNKDKIDFLDFKSIPSVDADNLLALKREGQIGQPGISVMGETILPRNPRKMTIRAGKGARVEENMVFSSMSGRPMVKIIGSVWFFYVDPYLRHFGDINLSTGNQNFRGNIEVCGDVCDGMTVRAGGNICIMGCINQAKVIAMESVQAGKCIGALVHAGGNSHYIGNCYFTLKELHTNLESLSKVVSVLLDSPKLKKHQNQLAQVFLLLIEKKFTKIPTLLKNVVHFLEITPMDMPPEIKTLIEIIREHVPPRNLTPKKLQLLLEYIEMAQNYFAQLNDNPADVHVDYASNSVIVANSDVYITQKGCFNSKITAGGNVYIRGIIRGGEVNAKGSIEVEKAGSEIGTRTILKTESNEIKILKKIYDGVIINVAGRKLEVTKTMGAVKFINHDGQKINVVSLN